MAKKIAASRKATRKAPAAKKASAKKITAPKTHKPSGSPKEKLAYLNRGEMTALSKRKGSGPVRGPKGLPSFAEDSASSKGVSRGDSSGTKGSGSTKTATGSVSKGGSYNSGTSGSRGGGASTQAPGMGRNEGRVGPVSPMGGQGASFATNKAARDDTLRRAYGIEDRRGLMGPFKGDMPNGLMFDRDYGRPFNPNNPYTGDKAEKARQIANDERDKEAREQARAEADFYRNPQEIREAAYGIRKSVDRMKQLSEGASYGQTDPLSQERFRTNVVRSAASSRLPDIKVGSARTGGFGRGNSGGNQFKAGGLVKNKSRKTFKKK